MILFLDAVEIKQLINFPIEVLIPWYPRNNSAEPRWRGLSSCDCTVAFMPNVSLYSSRSQEVTTEWHRQQNKEYPVGSSPLKPFLVTLTDGTCKLLLPLMCVKYNLNVNTALLKMSQHSPQGCRQVLWTKHRIMTSEEPWPWSYCN